MRPVGFHIIVNEVRMYIQQVITRGKLNEVLNEAHLGIVPMHLLQSLIYICSCKNQHYQYILRTAHIYERLLYTR